MARHPPRGAEKACPTYSRKEVGMRILNIVTSPRKERSASIGIIDSFLFAYQEKIKGLVVDTLDVWTESLPEFGAEAIGAKYKRCLRRGDDAIGNGYMGKD